MSARAALAVVLIALMLGPGPGPTLAQPPIRVVVNGEEVAFDVPPIEVGGRLLVPLRGVFERLGATVQWDPGSQRIIATTRGRTIELVVGRRDAALDGRPVVLDVPPTVVEGRTMVPLRFISEALGAFVQWQAATRTVQITVPVGAPPAPPAPAPAPTPPPTPAPLQTPTPTPPPPPTPAPTPTPPGTRIVEGVLVLVGTASTPPRIQVSVGAIIHVFQVTPQTAILRFDAATGSGGSVALSALRVGDQARVEAEAATNNALTVRASYRLVRGRVDALTPTAVALQDGQIFRINADGTATVNGAPVAIGDAPARVRRGDEIVVRLNPASSEAWELTITSPGAPTPSPVPAATPTRLGPSGTLRLVAEADAPLIEASPGSAHPREALLVGRDAGGRYRSVVAFDIPLPPAATVRRATLRLFLETARSGGGDIYTVFPVNRAWTEASATWSTLAGAYALSAATGPVAITSGASRVTVEWDVTGIVRAWVDRSLPNHGFLIRNLEMGANLLQFAQREGAPGGRPRLVIEYSGL